MKTVQSNRILKSINWNTFANDKHSCAMHWDCVTYDTCAMQ